MRDVIAVIAGLMVILIPLTLWVAFYGTIIYIAWHFISKFW